MQDSTKIKLAIGMLETTLGAMPSQDADNVVKKVIEILKD